MQIKFAHISTCIFFLSVLIGCSPTEPQDKRPKIDIDFENVETIDYAKHVQPVFDVYCVNCHGIEEPAAGLQLDSWEHAFDGSDYGEAVIPYDSSNSVLYEMLTELKDGPHPVEVDGDSLPNNATQFIGRWIAEGAKSDDGTVAYSDSKNRLYVCNQGDGTISIIDTRDLVVIRTIDITEYGFNANAKPHHVVVEPNGEYWYVSLIDGNAVLKFTAENEFVGSASVEIPALMAIHPAADTLYASRFKVPGGNVPQSVVPIERSTMTVGDPIPVLYDIPHGIAISPSGDELYVASLSNHRIIFMDTQSNEIESLLLGNSKAPLQIAVSPDGGTLYVSAQLSNELFVIDVATHTIRATLSDGIGSQPWHPVVTSDGKHVYVGNLTSNSISVINANSNTALQPITGNGLAQPHGSATSSDGKFVFISNRNSGGDYVPRHDFGGNDRVGTVTVINTETNAIEKVLEVGKFASGLGIWEE